MQGWFGFYSVAGGFAATLLGLLFVAISINAEAIFGDGHENSRRLAEQAFQNYFAVMMVALLAIFPTLEFERFGLVTLVATAVWGIWVLYRLYLAFTRPHDPGSRLQAIRRQFASFVGFGMLLFAAWETAFHGADSRRLFAIGTLVLLFSATAVSWELLHKIAKVAVSRSS